MFQIFTLHMCFGEYTVLCTIVIYHWQCLCELVITKLEKKVKIAPEQILCNGNLTDICTVCIFVFLSYRDCLGV